MQWEEIDGREHHGFEQWILSLMPADGFLESPTGAPVGRMRHEHLVPLDDEGLRDF